jgi:hypothetical protein
MNKDNIDYYRINKMTEVEKLKAQLEIAVEVLKYYANKRKCQKALEKIKEIEKGNKKVIDNKKNESNI